MMKESKGPLVALVTGARRGIGYEVVRELAQKGWRVFLSARERSTGEASAEKLRAEGLSVEFVEMDVSNPESVWRAAKEVSDRADRLDALVNNAGMLGPSETGILELNVEAAASVIGNNALSALLVTQNFLPLLRKSARACVINVSSGAGSLAEMSGWAPAYAISKTTLNAVTRQLHFALQDAGIPINVVCPGWVRTEMGGASAPRSVEQGADTIVWLATEAPRTLSGQFLRDRQPIAW